MPFQKKINYVEYSANDESEEEQETVASAEWIQNNKKLVMCPFGKKEPESYGFNITKADKIFDLLLSEGLIKVWSVAAFIQRFGDVKNWCYSLVLSDQQLADSAFNGLLPHTKDKYASQEFESISQIASRMIGEIRSYES